MKNDDDASPNGSGEWLRSYLRDGFGQIEGWCSPELAPILEMIDLHQRSHSVHGGAAEIGVHHGKFFLMLNALCDADELSYAIDLFDQQELNIDFSGAGNREIFEANLAKFDRHGGRNVRIIAADSTSTKLPAQIDHEVRIFSVDGGHTVEHT